MNDLQSEKQHPLEKPRKRHPLETPPAPPAAGQPPRQRVNLRIPAVAPNVTYILIAINVAVFVIRALSRQLDSQIFIWGANHPPDVLLKGEYYRLFTAMFLHAGIFDPLGDYQLGLSIHLISNMYVLYAVGASMERLFGHARFLVIYLLGGLTGSLFTALLSGSEVYSLGASGAVFAVIGAEFVYLYHHRTLMGAAGLARRRSLIALAVLTLIGGIVSTLPGSIVQIDNWGHVGGLLGGLFLSWFICPILNLRAHPDHPGEILGEDINPFNKRYWIVSVYATALVVVLFAGVYVARH
jgi:rhomboid protease GluP